MDRPKNISKRLKSWFSILFYGGLIILLAVVFSRNFLLSMPVEITQTYFFSDILPANAVEKIRVEDGEKAFVFIKKDFADKAPFMQVLHSGNSSAIKPGPHYVLSIASAESFERKIDEYQNNIPSKQRIPIDYTRSTGGVWNILGWLLPLVILFIFWRMLLMRSSRESSSMFSFGKSKATYVDKDSVSRITFNDVAGLEEAELEVREIVDFLKNPGRFTRLGAKIPKGVILVGPPGTGKTLLARAVAGEAGVPFYSMSGSEFVEMFVGVGASRVRDLFSMAKEKTPSIVFIDEIDAIGRSRGKNAFFVGSNDERESTLNQLLKEMDGFESNSGVIVLAATNRGDMLDPALLRPGRFDRHIYLELPNKNERQAIFKVHMRPLKLDEAVDVELLAAQTPGFSGADIANVCNEAALIAARQNCVAISRDHFMDAIDRIIAGLEKKSKVISPAEKKVIAYHEAGHALISWLMRKVDPLLKISIIPRGKTLGAAWYLPEEKQLRTESEFIEHISATLGGRAAEEIVFDEVSSGVLDDLEKATREAYMMVAYLGFNDKIGPISFYDSTGQHENGLYRPYSEETARMIDEEVRKLISTAYENVKEILLQQRIKLDKLAGLLLQKETLLRSDLESVLGQREIKLTPSFN